MTDAPRLAPVHGGLTARLGAAIVHGQYPAGARLFSGDIASAEGVSRSAVREVVRVLETLGLVRSRRKAGIEVQPASEWDLYSPDVIRWRLAGPDRLRQLHELSQLRSAVEPLAARLAASAADAAQRSALSQAAHDLARHSHEADGQPYLEADLRFHRVLLEASGNPMLARLAGAVESVLVGRTQHALMPTEANPDALRLHRDVAFAVAAGDAAAAAEAAALIVAESDDAVQRLDGSSSSGRPG
ncbi:FCD domain-containing protein [Gryllotalpicola daejeonensis]|uniref:FCD domain-containing protein n=1 Tax=Gryllotalpicola daejeonensis TaxID=993087 RepID=A0ABP7ZM50_9MICO